MAILQISSGPQKGRQYDLSQEKYVLGRHPECDIVVDTGAVSRYHAQVLHEEGRFFVEDLKSRNGTFVNGKMINGREALTHGDVIQICDLSLRFVERVLAPEASNDPLLTHSRFHTFVIEDDTSTSTIMSKVEVSASNAGSVQVMAKPEVKLRALIEINHSLGQALALDEVLPNVLDGLFKIFIQFSSKP